MEKQIVFQGQGTWQKFRGILNPTSKSVKGQEILFLSSHKSRSFLAGKGSVVSKNIYEGIYFCGFICHRQLNSQRICLGHNQPK